MGRASSPQEDLALSPWVQPAGLDSVGTWTWACWGEGRSCALVDSLLGGNALPTTPAAVPKELLALLGRTCRVLWG